MHLYSQTYHTVMDILPLCVMVSFIHGVTLVLSNDATVNNICLESINGSPTVPLSCGSNKRIHVISERYGNTTHEQCGQNTNIYATFLMNNDDGLIVNCNGKKNTICHEGILSSVSCKPVCAIESKHECVADSMSVCSVVNTRSQNEIVYLHSPGFPDPDKEDNNCSCRITGPMMTVTVLEYHPGDGAVSIFPDSKPVFPSVFTLYNKVIATGVSTAVVNYEDKNETGSMWIKVTGTGPLNIVCMEVSNITSSKIPTSTQATTKDLTSNSESTSSNPVVTVDAVTPSTSNDRTTHVTTDAVSSTSDAVTPSTSNDSMEKEATEAASNTSDTDDINIAAIVGGLCGVILLLLVIISLLLYFKVIKPTRNHPSAKKTDISNEQDITVSHAHYADVTDSTSDSPTRDGAFEISRHSSNPYDDLSRYENQGVHEYGQLHLYEGTESRVEPSQDNRTYSGLSNYVNHGDHHNYGEIRRDK